MTKDQMPDDINIRFMSVNDGMPTPWKECIVCVVWSEYPDDYPPSFFYGAHDGKKWVGAMAWDSCGDGSSNDCVSLDELHGDVVAWALFPKSGQD